MGHLEEWFLDWVPDSVYSAGGGRSSIEAWKTTSLYVVEVLSCAVDSDVSTADVVKSFDTVDREVLDRVLSRFGVPGFVMCIMSTTRRFGDDSSLLQGKASFGLGIPQGLPSVRCLLLPCMSLGVGTFMLWVVFASQRYANNLKCVPSDPDLTAGMSVSLARSWPTANIFGFLLLWKSGRRCVPGFCLMQVRVGRLKLTSEIWRGKET